MISDKNLYDAFRNGDIHAFEKLVIKYRHNLVYFIMQFVGNYHTSEDIAQEVFAYLYLHPEKYSNKYEFKTFLLLLGKRRAIDYLRKESRGVCKYLEEADVIDFHSMDELIDNNEKMIVIRKALEGLKSDYRQVLFLLYFNELSIAETATVLDKSVASVKVMSHRAKKQLKQILDKGGVAYEI